MPVDLRKRRRGKCGPPFTLPSPALAQAALFLTVLVPLMWELNCPPPHPSLPIGLALCPQASMAPRGRYLDMAFGTLQTSPTLQPSASPPEPSVSCPFSYITWCWLVLSRPWAGSCFTPARTACSHQGPVPRLRPLGSFPGHPSEAVGLPFWPPATLASACSLQSSRCDERLGLVLHSDSADCPGGQR